MKSMQMNRRGFTLLLGILLTLCSNGAGAAQTPTPTPNASPSASLTATDEQKVQKDKDADKDYREMFDKLLDRATWFFSAISAIVLLLGGVLVWLVKWTLKETREDAQKAIQAELQKRGLAELEAQYNRMRGMLNSFRQRRIDWVRLSNLAEPIKELEFLQRAGLQKVASVLVQEGASFILNDPDLVILSYDGTPASKLLLKQMVELMKGKTLGIPLLVYMPMGLRLSDDEMKLINETFLATIANFPATLLSHALSLTQIQRD